MDVIAGILPHGSHVQQDATMTDLGVDSLSIVELRNMLSSNFCVSLSNEFILNNPSVAALEDAIFSEMYASDDSSFSETLATSPSAVSDFFVGHLVSS